LAPASVGTEVFAGGIRSWQGRAHIYRELKALYQGYAETGSKSERRKFGEKRKGKRHIPALYLLILFESWVVPIHSAAVMDR